MLNAGDGGFCQRSAVAVNPGAASVPLDELLEALERDRMQPVRARADAHALAGLAALLVPTEGAPDPGVLRLFGREILTHGIIFNEDEPANVPAPAGASQRTPTTSASSR